MTDTENDVKAANQNAADSGLAEQNSPVPGVSYQTVDEFILVSKFRQNRPSLAEFTTSQARAVPVICNVEQIYQIDAKLVTA